MKYYADYYNERVYAVDTNGEAVCKRIDDASGELKSVKFKRPNDEPWMWNENNVGDFIESMTADEYESFGKQWVWNPIPTDAERQAHSWRNFIKRL